MCCDRRLKACEPCPETVSRSIMDSAHQSDDGVQSNVRPHQLSVLQRRKIALKCLHPCSLWSHTVQ